MVFFPPHDDRYFIKRVIGLPGDKIEYRNKTLFVNGEEQSTKRFEDDRARSRFARYWEQLGDVEHEIQKDIASPNRYNLSLTVPDGHYFMMGDNRDRSADSREWGTVPQERIVGKAVAVWMHKQPGWNLPTFKDVRSIK